MQMLTINFSNGIVSDCRLYVSKSRNSEQESEQTTCT
jgi:hypothetical protein